MGKGGPLAFLNKKPWHPGNIQNQEEIWKREQAFLAEVEKREELKRQIEEEREAEENATQFQREKYGYIYWYTCCSCAYSTPCSSVSFGMDSFCAGLESSAWNGCTKEALQHKKMQPKRRKSIFWAKQWISCRTMALRSLQLG